MPADRKAISESSLTCHASPANTSATTVGIADWNTIAPVMLPIASVSLPWRTQISELNFSGSSVAIGAITSASSSSLTPSVVGEVLDRPDEQVRAADDAGEREHDLDRDDPQPRRSPARARRPRRSSPWNRSGARSDPSLASASASKWPFTY